MATELYWTRASLQFKHLLFYLSKKFSTSPYDSSISNHSTLCYRIGNVKKNEWLEVWLNVLSVIQL